MTYEGVTLENGLVVKNGSLVTKPDFDAMKNQSEELIARINSGPLPQTVARRKALEEARNKKKR